MTTMNFAMVETSLHDNPHWQALSGNRDARLAYLTIRTSSRLVYSGFFHYPLPLMAFESMLPMTELPDLISRLEALGLIEYDHISGWVRIVGWYYGPYAHENASKVTKRSRKYLEDQLPKNQVATNSVAEFIVGSLRRAGNFSEKSDHAEAVYAVLERFTRNAAQLFDGLSQTLKREFHQNGHSTWRHLRGKSEELIRIAKIEEAGNCAAPCHHSGSTLPAPCEHPASTVAPQREREREREKKPAPPDQIPTARPLQVTLESALVRGMNFQ